jgi:hypothetical protein
MIANAGSVKQSGRDRMLVVRIHVTKVANWTMERAAQVVGGDDEIARGRVPRAGGIARFVSFLFFLPIDH